MKKLTVYGGLFYFYLKINLRMKLIFILAFSFLSISSNAQDIFGKWKSIDDNTNKPKSIVEITEKDGKAYGKIIELFREPDEDQDPICDDCSDHRKDQKVLGMTIITDMVKDGDEWEDGEILDPKDGKIYDCKIWVADDGTLKVRGYIAFFFRTQTWVPITD
jgi:uncharacterized protein (DUF2147 family)